MVIPFTCPHCGTKTDVSDQFAGHSGPCGHCGRQITIPGYNSGGGGVAPAPKRSTSGTLIVVVVAAMGMLVVCGGVMAALLLPAVQAAREAARRAQCRNNLAMIGVALHNYEADYRCLPPPYLRDENGRAAHSWRVLLLPYLGDSEADALYAEYDFDEPWDGPNNRELADRMPRNYRCPSAVGSDETSYQAVVGAGYLFDPTRVVSFVDVTDGMSSTIMVVEVANSPIHWMQPNDLAFQGDDPAAFDVSIDGDIPSSNHPGGFNALLADGSVHFLQTPSAADFQAMLTIAGGEVNVGVPTIPDWVFDDAEEP